ncbi:hypothetical protein BO03_04017, partial [Mycobacterium tuberculosis 94_M4241A]
MLHCNPEFLHVVRPKTPRGDGNFLPHAWATAFDQVVRPKTPRGDGNSRRGMARQAWLGGRQTQNPERGRKQHLSSTSYADQSSGRQTQNPERGRKLFDHLCGISGLRSSDPKPREGTETPMRRHFRLQFQPVVRPKTPRGDGNARNRPTWACPQRVVRPKTPRGDGNARNRPTWACPQRVVRPKTPRGDGNPYRGRRRCERTRRVVRPKTPRGDGNPTMASKSAWVTDPGRQTQNPERGRKPGEQRRRQPGGHGSVVRPKTPRGDGNQVSNGGGNLAATGRSSDPKPREGTETSSTIIAIPSPHVSSDPKPREGTETCANPFGVMRMVGSGRQTQNPERGRKP